MKAKQLVKAANEEKITQFEEAFDEIMQERIKGMIEEKRESVIKGIVIGEDKDEDEDESTEIDADTKKKKSKDKDDDDDDDSVNEDFELDEEIFEEMEVLDERRKGPPKPRKGAYDEKDHGPGTYMFDTPQGRYTVANAKSLKDATTKALKQAGLRATGGETVRKNKTKGWKVTFKG